MLFKKKADISIILIMNENLIKGSVTKSLLLFALPMILGNMLQQLYNVADTFIVGQFIGSNVLAAVGSSFTLMTFLNSIILGLCMGSGVLFSFLYGAKKMDKMKNAFFISFVGIGLLSVALEAGCLLLIDPILSFLQIPLEIWSDTHDYLFYIFLGILFTFLYNYFASLLRALGDSRTPLLFLGVSAIGNIILDIYFIVSLHMGVAGAAIATTMSQALSAIGLFVYVFFQQRDLLPQKEYWYFDKSVFQKIKDYSLLTCVQQSVMNFGILLIQGLVNSFGLVTMSAFAAAVKIDAFAYLPVQDFGNAFSIFIAQNYGAQNTKRIKAGIRVATIVSISFSLVVSLFVFIFAESLMTLFIDAKEVAVIMEGIRYLRIEGAFYFLIGGLFLLYGLYRAIAKPGMSVVLTVVSLGVRVILSYILSSISIIGVIGIWWSIPIGWLLADILGVGCYFFKYKKLNLFINEID